VRRRVGRVSVSLDVLDLTDPTTRAHLGVDADDLTADDCTVTRTIATAARDAGFDAVLAPAAATTCDLRVVHPNTPSFEP